MGAGSRKKKEAKKKYEMGDVSRNIRYSTVKATSFPPRLPDLNPFTVFNQNHHRHMHSLRLKESTLRAVSYFVDNNYEGRYSRLQYLNVVAATLFDCLETLVEIYRHPRIRDSSFEVLRHNCELLEKSVEELSRVVEACKRGDEIQIERGEAEDMVFRAKGRAGACKVDV